MKKIIAMLLVAMSTLCASAKGEQYMTLEGGVGVASMSKLDSRTGFHLGAIAEFPLANVDDGGYVNIGVLFKLKGAEKEYSGLEAKVNQYCFDVPLHIGYRYRFNPGFALFGEMGPYFGIGLFGKTWAKSGNEKVKADTYSDLGGVKRFDFGMGFKIGAEVAGCVPIAIGYDFGVLNVNKDGEPAMRNSYLSFSVGYRFSL